MNRAIKFLQIIASLFLIFISGNLSAAGYSCPALKAYTSCVNGYYMTSTPGSVTCYTTQTANNACRPCSVKGEAYTCTGGTTCPTVSCSAGEYWNGSKCTACTAGYYCEGFSKAEVVYVGSGRKDCPDGYNAGETNLKTIEACLIKTTAGNHVATPAGPLVACPADSFCPGNSLINYNSVGGSSTCPSIYLNSPTLGKKLNTQCQVKTTPGKYIAEPTDASETICEAGHECPSSLINHGLTGLRRECTGATFAIQGEDTCTSCPSIYINNLTDGKKAATSCAVNVPTGKFVKDARDFGLTDCPIGYTCGGGFVFWSSRSSMPIANNYTITFDGNGGIGGDNSTVVTYDSIMQNIAIPIRTNYTFDGYWDGAIQYYDAVGTPLLAFWNQTTDKTLTAQWTLDLITCAAGEHPNASGVCTDCPAGSYCGGGTLAPDNGVNECPDGYKDNPATNQIKIEDCQVKTTAGNYIAVSGADQVTCPGNSYCLGNKMINYKSVGGSDVCPSVYLDNTELGKSLDTQCQFKTTVGNYIAVSGADQVTCPGNSYCLGNKMINYKSVGGSDVCPSVYLDNTELGKSLDTQCQFKTTVGNYIAVSGADQVTCPGNSYCLGNKMINYKSVGGSDVCPSVYLDNTELGKSLDTQCQFKTTVGNYIAVSGADQVTCPGNSYCLGNKMINYKSVGGSDVCPSVYLDNTELGKSLDTQCQFKTTAGNYIAAATASSETICEAGYECPSSLISYGLIGLKTQCSGATYALQGKDACVSCPTIYINDLIAGKKVATSCAVNVPTGKYVKNYTDAFLSDCPIGYTCPASTVFYDSSSPAPIANSYTIMFDENGGTGGTASVIATYDSAMPTATMPARTNYTFNGYFDSAIQYYTSAGASAKNWDQPANKTLTAQWTQGLFACLAGEYPDINGVCTDCSAGSYCPGGPFPAGDGIEQCPNGYVNGAAGIKNKYECEIICQPGTYVAPGGDICTVLITDNKYIGINKVSYGNSSVPETCPVGWVIFGTQFAHHHDDITDCVQICDVESIAPPLGATKQPRQGFENYPNFCVYKASCPVGYTSEPGGASYPDGYSSAPSCKPITYTISVFANGGIIKDTSKTSIDIFCEHDADCYLKDQANEIYKFENPKYGLGGWSLSSYGPVKYQTGDNIKNDLTANMNLFAVWDICGSGFVWNGHDCSACPIGSYSPGGDPASGTQKYCTYCGHGKTTSAEASSDSSQCLTCPAGSYCDPIAVTCASVDDGSWSLSVPGAVNKKECFMHCSDIQLSNGTGIPMKQDAFYPNKCEYYCETPEGRGKVSGNDCIITSCSSDHEFINGSCFPCNRQNAISYKPDGNCVVETCTSGYHPSGKECKIETIECDSPNSSAAYRTWDTRLNAYGVCKIEQCDHEYHLSSNVCFGNEQVCVIENGKGIKEWDFGQNKWGECLVQSCNSGYTNDSFQTNELHKPCGVCKNKFNIYGEQAVSIYVQECEIGACMYQGEMHSLEGSECIPICDIAGSEDETGSMKWNPSTKKCVRQCKEGFAMW